MIFEHKFDREGYTRSKDIETLKNNEYLRENEIVKIRNSINYYKITKEVTDIKLNNGLYAKRVFVQDNELLTKEKTVIGSINELFLDKADRNSNEPNLNAGSATKLETARKIQLSGDVEGSEFFDGTKNINIPITVLDDSHIHDQRYNTKEEISKTIDTINKNINDKESKLNNRITTEVNTLNNTITAEKNNLNNRINNEVSTLNNTIKSEVSTINKTITDKFNSGSYPGLTVGNANKLTNARNIKLSGDVNGLTSFDGSANVDINVTVLDDSHIHDQRYHTKEEINSRFNTEISGVNNSIKKVEQKLENEKNNLNNRITTEVNNLNSRISNEVSTLNSTIITEKNNLNNRISQEVSTINKTITDKFNSGNYPGLTVGNANKLTNARNIKLSGDVNGNVNFDGSTNVDINVTVLDDSHLHNDNTIKNLDGSKIYKLSGYSKANSYTPISQSDSLIVSLGKLEKNFDNKANTSGTYTDITSGSANKLTNIRTINGANFDGTSNIVTNYWGANRNFTIGNHVVSVNGNNDVSFSIDQIGAISNRGGTMNGILKINNSGNDGIYLGKNGVDKVELCAKDDGFGLWNVRNQKYIFECRDNNEAYLRGSLIGEGNLTGFSRVYNAVWNDYAEFFERGEETEPGDIIALNESSDNEEYIKATKNSNCIVGVHSNSFAHLIGGEEAPEGEDFYEYNIKKYIPIGLAGRVYCKVIGEVRKGDLIGLSDIPGVGIVDPNNFIVGKSLEENFSKEIKLVKILIK